MPPPTMKRPPTCPVQSQGLVRNVSRRRPPRLLGKGGGGGGGGGRGQEGRGGEEGGDAAEALAHGAHAPGALGAVAVATGGGGTYDVTDAPGALLRRGGTYARCFREGGLGRVGLLLWRRAQIGWTFSAVGKG